jgi:DNA-binding response OmpR family regulator
MLSNRRVLVVEDELLVAEHIKDVLSEAEGVTVGPIPTVAEARQLVRNGLAVDAAILDLNLSDGSVTPLLEALRARGIPTLLYTGGAVPEALLKRHPDLRVLRKPVAPARLVAELRRMSRTLVA